MNGPAIRTIAGLTVALFYLTAGVAAAQEATRTITKIAGDLYRFPRIKGANLVIYITQYTPHP